MDSKRPGGDCSSALLRVQLRFLVGLVKWLVSEGGSGPVGPWLDSRERGAVLLPSLFGCGTLVKRWVRESSSAMYQVLDVYAKIKQ